MAVKKTFSHLRASGAKVAAAVGYTAAAIQLSSRAMVIAAARLNNYLSSDMDEQGKKLLAQIDEELMGK